MLSLLINPMAGIGIGSANPFTKRTALHLCAACGHIDAARACLHLGASPSQQDSGGATPSHVAAEHCQVEVLNLLLEIGVNLSLPDRQARRETC